MTYNIDCDVFEAYPELLHYEEFAFTFDEGEFEFDLQRAFIYVCLAYDPESTYFKIADVLERKRKAFKHCGLPKRMEEEVVTNRNSRVNKMVRRFFILLNRDDIEVYLSAKEAIHTLLEEARRPVTEDLQDDKRMNALKSKKMCVQDSMDLLSVVNKLELQLNSRKVDIDEVMKVDSKSKVDEWSGRDFVERMASKNAKK
jgi:hypothetical protein